MKAYHVDTGDGDCGVNDDTLARWEGDKVRFCVVHLVGNKGRDVRLETTSTSTHDEHGDNQASEGAVGVLEDGRETGDNQNNMPDHSDQDGPADSLVSAPVSIPKALNISCCQMQRSRSHLSTYAM